MIREVSKGNKVPYNGYLLGKKEYHDYQRLRELAPDIKEILKIIGSKQQ